MEIGGYYELEQNEDNSYHKNAIKLNSGRNCLRVLIRNRQIKRIHLPYYICNAVIEACHLENCQMFFYFIGQNFRPKGEIIGFEVETDYLYLVNYGGLLTAQEVLDYQKTYQNIILDNTQAFFMKPIPDVDMIYSSRKFFGVPDGAYLYTSAEIVEQYEMDYSYDRIGHILGRYELDAGKFYEAYTQNEEKFSAVPIRYMSKLTDNMMRGIDYGRSLDQRSNNYSLLHRKLSGDNRLTLPGQIKGAFSYPLLINDAREIRDRLIEEKIYIPQYWREVLSMGLPEDSVECQYVKNIIWLPCDQRYGEVEMNYIVDKIGRIIEI